MKYKVISAIFTSWLFAPGQIQDRVYYLGWKSRVDQRAFEFGQGIQ